MKREDRRIIAGIIALRGKVYEISDGIKKEQERVISDMLMPAKKAAASLIALDNRMVDICNVKVLYAFMERELGKDMSVLIDRIKHGEDSPLFRVAENGIKKAGYSLSRAKTELMYLFENFKLPKKKPETSRLPCVDFEVSLARAPE